MTEIKIRDWKILADSEKTRQAYKNIKADSESCGCFYCKNFIAARDSAFPADFLNIISELGIVKEKDAQIMHIGQKAKGKHLYEISYYFSGKIISGPAKNKEVTGVLSEFSPIFCFWIDDEINYRTELFPKPVLALRCSFQMPWTINEKEPEN